MVLDFMDANNLHLQDLEKFASQQKHQAQEIVDCYEASQKLHPVATKA
jgi:hypothetical protein